MKKYLISGAIIGGLCVYFFMALVVLPQEYLSHKIIEPQPTQAVILSNDEITLGESFTIEIEIENKNESGVYRIEAPSLQINLIIRVTNGQKVFSGCFFFSIQDSHSTIKAILTLLSFVGKA